jgi:CelD/BcsL family acetyltransferase involved in cellulose biosynthesis
VRGALTLEPLVGLEAAREDWSELARRSGDLFATWEWAEVWWRHFDAGRELAVSLGRDADGRAVAVLPLCVRRLGPLRVARFVGHGVGDHLGPVCACEDDALAVEVLLRSARSGGVARWDVLLAEQLRPGGLAGALGGRTLRREASPVVRLGGRSWDDYLASRSANFRSQIGRKERKLVREHGLRYRLSADPERLESDMRTLFALHSARWGEGSSAAFRGPAADFHLDFARVAQARGWLRLWFAELDGRPVAAWHGFRYGGADWYYQMGRDPAWERASIGLVLLAHTLRQAAEDRMRDYMLLRGDEAYKSRFATDDPSLDTVVRGVDPLGRAAAGAAALGAALPGPLRRLATRALG